MSCKQERIEKYFFNELSKEEDDIVFNHIVSCQTCSDYFATLSAVDDYIYDNKDELNDEYLKIQKEKKAKDFVHWAKRILRIIKSPPKILFVPGVGFLFILMFLLISPSGIIPWITESGASDTSNTEFSDLAALIENENLSAKLQRSVRGTSLNQSRDNVLNEAIMALNHEKFNQTLEILDQLKNSHVDSKEQQLVDLLMGMAYLRQWQNNKVPVTASIEALNRAKQGPNEPYREYAFISLAHIYLLEKSVEKAKSALASAKLLEQDHYLLLARILTELEQME